jgi:membrane-associated phospholipid phosphatase
VEQIAAADRRRVVVLLIAAAIGLVAFAVIYVVMVRTAAGQRLDDTAVAGRVFASARVREGTGRLLGTISVSSLAAAGLLLMTIALFRGRWRLAIGAGVLVFGSTLLAEIFKHVLLQRPHLIAEPPQVLDNSFPSGHTAIAASLGLALVLVTPRHRRVLAAIAGFLYSLLLGVGVLAAGWHRPSDPMGSICLVFSVSCLVAAGLVVWRGGVRRTTWVVAPSPVWWRLVVAGLVAAVPVVVLARTFVGRHPQLVLSTVGRRFTLATLSIGGFCLVAFVAFVILLRGVTLDHPD